jgi:hypothetical protein
LVVACAAVACERDPLPEACPQVAPGELVISEIRGPQSGGTDTLGQWVEVYNASSRVIGIGGLGLRMRKLDGSGDVTVLVRSATPKIAAHGYAVLGRFAAGQEPAYVTYGFLGDFTSNLYPSAAFELDACGTRIDEVRYASLPGAGSLAFDGARDPDASANDDPKNWCVDAAGTNHPGTPLERNHPCAP